LSGLYDNPKYYEIAFSFRDIPAEVDVFEECFKRFSQISVKSVLELGCGNSPQMEELIKRGYQYNGLDLSQAMLDYSREKALRIGAEVNLIHADMIDFSLDTTVDFVYVFLGSLYVKSTSELLTHFNSVAQVLKKGGLYLLDWCIQYDPLSEGGDSWEIERDGFKVKTVVSWKAINRVEQTFEEAITLEVNDHGEKHSIVGKEIKRAIYPQEFLCFVSGFKHFEFVGWWNNWDLRQPLEQANKIDRPIALVRRI
jgi:SAM-dependent methyltransferase